MQKIKAFKRLPNTHTHKKIKVQIGLRILGWIIKAAQFSGRGAKCGTDFNMSGQNNGTK